KAAAPPFISAVAALRMAVGAAARKAAAVAALRMVGVAVAAAKASIDANPGFNPALTVPEQSRATHALMGERASQRRHNRTVVARNPFSRFAMRRLAFSLLAIVLIGVLPAFAQEAPPARVGRVSFVSGQLGVHLAGETAWSAAKVNYPVATGGSFWTDPKSRAELRIGSRTISFAGDTVLDVTKLDQQVMQLAVSQGRINLRVRTLLEGESIEIDLPRGAVWILQPGIYDIDSGGPDQPQRIAVFVGSAGFVGCTLDVPVNGGCGPIVSGSPALVAFVGEPGVGYWDAPGVGPAVGWFPLAPGEVYWPSYTRNAGYIRNVNIANVSVTTINQIASVGGSRGAADPPPQVASQNF